MSMTGYQRQMTTVKQAGGLFGVSFTLTTLLMLAVGGAAIGVGGAVLLALAGHGVVAADALLL